MSRNLSGSDYRRTHVHHQYMYVDDGTKRFVRGENAAGLLKKFDKKTKKTIKILLKNTMLYVLGHPTHEVTLTLNYLTQLG